MPTMTTEPDRELTVVEVALRLGVGTERVRERIKSGKLKARKEGRSWRIKEGDFKKYLKETET